jgi:hypothetical protein
VPPRSRGDARHSGRGACRRAREQAEPTGEAYAGGSASPDRRHF